MPDILIPPVCQMCHIEGAVTVTGPYFHCIDSYCGASWPVPIPEPEPIPEPNPSPTPA